MARKVIFLRDGKKERKSLSDFECDYQAYANYLESPECAWYSIIMKIL